MSHTNASIKRSQIYYIIQAALEYFVAILVSGSYLATLTAYLGISDGVTGIISSIISLGCVFQLLSIFLKRKQVKKPVVLFSILNILLFMMLYFVPLAEFSKQLKIVLFITMILAAYIIYNAIHPLKSNWLMSLVEDHRRGIFSAHKEIISLLSGMVFTFVTGRIIDHYRDAGQIETALIICGIGILIINIFHTLTLVFSVEPEMASEETKSNPFQSMFASLKNPAVFRLTVLYSLWNIAAYVATPFYGSYQIKELGFSLTFISILGIAYSIIRACVSAPWGKLADRQSFIKVVQIGLIMEAVAYLLNVFLVPANGFWLYSIHYILLAISAAGLNSAKFNLVFDYIPTEERSDAIAISQAISGVVGFLTTLAASALVTLIQNNQNTFLGIPVYAQQVCSLIAFITTILVYLYTTGIIMKKMHRLHR